MTQNSESEGLFMALRHSKCANDLGQLFWGSSKHSLVPPIIKSGVYEFPSLKAVYYMPDHAGTYAVDVKWESVAILVNNGDSTSSHYKNHAFRIFHSGTVVKDISLDSLVIGHKNEFAEIFLNELGGCFVSGIDNNILLLETPSRGKLAFFLDLKYSEYYEIDCKTGNIILSRQNHSFQPYVLLAGFIILLCCLTHWVIKYYKTNQFKRI